MPQLPESETGPIVVPDFFPLELQQRLIALRRREKFVLLLQAIHNEDPDQQRLGAELAFRLAVAFHPAFQIAEPAQPTFKRGRPRGRSEIDHMRLFGEIEKRRLKAELDGKEFSVRRTCVDLARQRRGPFSGQNPDSLETIYRSAGKELAASIASVGYAPEEVKRIGGYLGSC